VIFHVRLSISTNSKVSFNSHLEQQPYINFCFFFWPVYIGLQIKFELTFLGSGLKSRPINNFVVDIQYTYMKYLFYILSMQKKLGVFVMKYLFYIFLRAGKVRDFCHEIFILHFSPCRKS